MEKGRQYMRQFIHSRFYFVIFIILLACSCTSNSRSEIKAQAPPTTSLTIGVTEVISPTASIVPTIPSPQVITFENYAEGIVTEVSSDKIIITTDGDVELHLLPESEIWKGDYEGTNPVEVGDEVIVWGQPHEDGKIIDVEKMWGNIVNLRGSISDIEQTAEGFQLRLDDAYTGMHLIKFNQQTAVVMTSKAERIVNSKVESRDGIQIAVIELELGVKLQLSEGKSIQVIGLRLNDGSILAGRVWIGN